MLLLIPMVFSVYTDETETNDRSLSVFEYLQKIFVLCTGKNLYVYEKILICTRKICMYIKNGWDLHRKGGPLVSEEFQSGIIILLEPMDSVYKQTNENKRKK